ncbi:type II toxin-antitoxin system RelE/ParE family toxin [Methylobacterium sp. BTF04]|uniref:type II toxin-antitoxin system RelE/ParE family toxin n=1 Tax=Methylobacterium sp. BTF04 TaxID=2708300 RepID=UPI0013D42EAB|nr:type II toxin-antitoxin system RelE/ParE family toxin [Methylobacterium sp. BTF04]
MTVRYTLTAARQIEAALDYLAAESPQAARGLQQRILTVIVLLQAYPQAGRATSKVGIRRIPLNTYPYLVDYRANAREIIVLRFRHAARPPVA